ncbi:MAG: hypothetical protein Q9N02_06995, partial [Ghiorsea sp.]|nr:hypothetical protein [Ghiorsea sp.]
MEKVNIERLFLVSLLKGKIALKVSAYFGRVCLMVSRFIVDYHLTSGVCQHSCTFIDHAALRQGSFFAQISFSGL